jgi:hypothetical protein
MLDQRRLLYPLPVAHFKVNVRIIQTFELFAAKRR